jgi:GNAT superfamily N-acetyltransferase
MSLEIREISEKNLGVFIDYPYSLFKDHPHWVGELKKDVRHLLETGHPFWRHGERKLFMAWRGSKPVGRVAAIVNQAHNNFHGDRTGFFGFFDCEDDKEVANALFAAAGAWLKTKGMDSAVGPVNPSTNETCGLLLEGFDGPPMVMMPYTPQYYLGLAEAAGFTKAKDLLAFRVDVAHGFGERFEKIVQRLTRGKDIKVRHVDGGGLDKAIAEVKEIYNAAWEKNWGFVPMSDAEFNDMATAMKPVLKPEYLYFADVDGKPAAFVLLLPNLNIPLRAARGSLNPLNLIPFLYRLYFKMACGRMLTLGVKQEYRGRGLEMLMIKQAFEGARKMGWEYGEMSWTLEDNTQINSVIEAIGGRVYRKYRVFEKKL